ncbi:klarsicht protein isoform X1 [Zeugodacus cucurbitae]|uniref:klarsicht protein isoform X1 n=1 Tax=Zeugodacus cucurbitae TaxID=28588 RepID=UPI0023D92AE3|nr:klarsicht protein isoform X1 [Zeugodacus cucurbitae]XP_011183763.2 klarsicht protein isoform X1 [Zeugodacus cucurbitae]XP_011183764.2 klarsicht protein isoform X1 [Zeugodacus cucurbitae]
MDLPKREKVNVVQPNNYQQTLNIRNTSNNTNNEGTSQSTDTSEIFRDQVSKCSPIKTITPPISISAGGTLTEVAPKAVEAVVNSNEETEYAAMVYADASKMSTTTPINTIPKTLVTNIAITTNEYPENAQLNSKIGEFIIPAIPDTKPIIEKGGVGGAVTNIKKKRNKNSKKREDNKTRNIGNKKANINIITRNVTDGDRCQPNMAGHPINAIASGTANMKASVSMTSLPPDDEKAESRDVIKAKLNVERPYNSLKKNIERNAVGATLGVRANCFSQSQSSASSFANHRYSWGSGYSYSSSSLQSSATLGLGSAKDDLWAAIQTNYNYIMDTNLLDSCKETERHLADQNQVIDVECEQSHCDELLGVTQRREISWHDPQELRKWLREMEERLESAPSLSTATMLTTAELEHCLADHSVLYHEIVSHARVVSACIRSATEGHQGQVEGQRQQSIDSCRTIIAEQTNSSLTSNEETTTLTIATANEQNNHELSSGSSTSGIETAEKSLCSPRTSLVRSNTASPQKAEKTKITEDSLERLQNRYHLLYLKAFEVQLWLDGLLRKKSSTASIVDAVGYIDDTDNINCHSSDCEEDETAATENDFNILGSGIDSDITHNSSSVGELPNCIDLVEEGNCEAAKGDCEDGDDEGEDEDDDEVDFGRSRFGRPARGYNTVLVTFEKRGASRSTTLTDFEADSESSDWEVTAQQVSVQKKSDDVVVGCRQLLENEEIPTNSSQIVTPIIGEESSKIAQLPFDIHTSSSATFDSNLQQDDIVGLIANKQHERVAVSASPLLMKSKMNMLNADVEQRKLVSMSASTAAATITTTTANETNATSAGTQTAQKLQTLCNNKPIGLPIKQKSIAIISPNSHNNKSPTVLRKRQSQHHTDISKFNRSNRKSKNCAVFYFKHLDTDNETNCSSVGDGADFNTTADGLSSSNSQTSEHHLLKSADASSDDDGGWLYSSVLPPQREEDTSACEGVGVDEKGNICITTIVIDGLKSSAVTSSSAVTTAPTANSVINDDSDKENTEARTPTLAHATLTPLPASIVCAQSYDISSAPSSQNHTQIVHAEIQLTPVTTATPTALSVGRFKEKSFVASCGSGSSSSYSTRSSSCSSNDLLTETTSATNTTQITQMHFQRVHRTEMELQIDANGNKSKQMMDNGAIRGVTTNNSHNNNNNGDADNFNESSAIKGDNNANYNVNSNSSIVVLHQQQLPQQPLISGGNNQKNEMFYSVRWHPKTVSDSTDKTSMQHQQSQKTDIKKVLLPPRSPLKSEKPVQSTARGDNFSPTNMTKGKLSHESIKQLVLEAEHLVRDVEALKTPINKQKQKHSVIKLSSTVKKRDIVMPGPIKQRVQEWLEHQPSSSTPVQGHRNHSDELQSGVKSKAGDDCEASGEASESDSVPQLGSDTSEGLTESIATCMQTSTNSYGGNSTECFGSSAEPIASSATIQGYGSSNQSLNVKIVKRSQSRRKSERPWSVSCLSQLTTETVQTEAIEPVVSNAQTGLATHSISESALDSLSPGRQRVSSASALNVTQVKASNSKGSLKRRKTRKKKMSTSGNLGVVASNSHSVLKKSPDSGSEDTAEMPRLTQTLLMKSCESMSTQQIREITSALLSLQHGNVTNPNEGATGGSNNAAQYTIEKSQQHAMQEAQKDMGEGVSLMKPNFRVGSYTSAYMRNEKRLGSLAALATYMNDDEEEQQGEYTTGTEDHHSSFSETAWDNYQEKYNSENYSEGFDSDAARKLMEFGDDYRNFIDSQSDCCSSLSAANNLDSLSPPRMDSLQQADTKTITQDTIANSVDHARRRRALDLEYERRRKTLEVRRKSCQDSTDTQNTRSPVISTSSSVNAITPRIGFERVHQQIKSDTTGRKLEFGMSQSAQSLRRTSESDTSTRRRKIDDRRRSSRNLDKSIKAIPATSSSSCDDSDNEKEMRNLLQQSRNRLEDTEALKIRCHLLRPEDYTEIISTCRDNIRCLEAVIRGPPGTVLSAQCAGQTKDLLAAWEDLLSWSENAASARKMQEEMIILKHSLNKLGNNGTFELLDTEPQIQVAIEALKNEKTELQNYRTNMLRLNASVHSWLTRQERRLQNAIAEEESKDTGIVDVESLNKLNMPSVDEGDAAKCSSPGDTVTTNISAAAKNMSASIGTSTVGSSTKVLDIQTLINSENEFHRHLKNEVSEMYSAWDDADARINSQLETLTNSLLAWRQLESGLYEFQQALGHDRGTLKGLEGALDKGQTTPVELAQNVKVVAKLLSERVNVSEEQLTAVREHLDPNHILHITKFTASNGSLSDSGISDGGATSDGGLSERERRLGVLRRLVKQLELALAPGSEAMKSIAVRMESAEAELKNLQNTCRDLIVRTAATHQNKKMQQKLQKTEIQQLLVPVTDIGGKGSKTPKSNGPDADGKNGNLTYEQNYGLQCNGTSKRNGRRRQNKRSSGSDGNIDKTNARITNNNSDATEVRSHLSVAAPDSGDPADDPDLEFDLETGDKKNDKVTHNSWAWRIAKAAVPMQLALITFLCAACLMQPNCCDNLNNLSMSFTPQLRYIRGPPPI